MYKYRKLLKPKQLPWGVNGDDSLWLSPIKVIFMTALLFGILSTSGINDGTVYAIVSSEDSVQPVPDAGQDQIVSEGEEVFLDAANTTSGSYTIESWLWEEITGSGITITNSTESRASFTAPEMPAIDPGGIGFIFRLTITDNEGNEYSDICIVNVVIENQPPIADAGSDQNVSEGETVQLDGTNSSDTDGVDLTWHWDLISGPDVVLSDADIADPTFEAPIVDMDVSLTFRLTVADDSGLFDTSTCVVNIIWQNRRPVADAGDDQDVVEETTVQLNGSNSSDDDDGISTILWEQVDGQSVTLSNSTILNPTFAAPSVSGDVTLTFELTVEDSGGLEDTDRVVINVSDNSSSGGGGGGCIINPNAKFDPTLILLVLGSILYLIRRNSQSKHE